jgi:pimeloyl-ACP methyl ester carboxylesterase
MGHVDVLLDLGATRILLVPPEVDLQVDGNFAGLEQSEEERNGLRVLSWRAEEVPPMPTEPFAPPAQELMPWLNYGFGVTWQDVGDVIRDRVIPVLRSSPELRRWGREALVGDGPEEELASLMAALVEEVETGGGELAIGVAAADSFDRMSDLARIQVPALILAGTNDALTPVKYAEFMAAGIADHELHLIEGAGHMFVTERPCEVAKWIEAWLRNL